MLLGLVKLLALRDLGESFLCLVNSHVHLNDVANGVGLLRRVGPVSANGTKHLSSKGRVDH